ncbi:MAG: carboxypeptidase-like regulatory domain-containing protein, partial [bacterium]
MRKHLFIGITSALLLFYSAPNFSAQTGGTVTITGRVTDGKTYQPLENVNVFIANTMIGAATNSQGVYEIKNVPLGRNEMVVTMIGYKTRRLQLKLIKSKRYRYDFKMKSQVLSAPSIEISAKESKKWRKRLEKFEGHFLGTSKNASQCTIMNPEVLEFKDGKDGSKHYIAVAHEPLEIENKALGYRLYFLLNRFEAKNNRVIYGGDARFEEIASANISEKKTWQKNRQKTYDGSLRHFLASLNANRFRREGFYAENVLDISRDKMSGLRSEIRKRDILTSGELPNEKRINFKNYLEVMYTHELEEEAYVNYRLSKEFASGFKKPESLSKLREPLEQKSWIFLNSENVAMDTLGHLIDPLSMTTYGYWAWQRVGDMLPLDYMPLEEGFLGRLQAAISRDYYKEGKLMLDAGNWDKAIKIWSEGKQALEDENKADPRIAIAFIEQVTRREASFYYEKACDFYYWGFSTDELEKYQKDIAEEIERIAPLLSKEEAEGWRKDLEKKRPVVLSKIKSFWISRDPNPASTLNERLVEHWERIAYARKNFNKGANTVYGTDDRGLIYVKYGEPEQKREITLGNNSQEIRTVANMLQIPAFSVPEFIRAVEQFLTFPTCEIWSYRRLSTTGQVIYL